MQDNAAAAAVMDREVLDRGALAVAVLGDGQHLRALACARRADHIVALGQTDAAHAGGLAAHRAHLGLGKGDGAALVGGDQDILLAVGQAHVDEQVIFCQAERAQAGLADVLQVAQDDALDNAAAGDKDHVLVVGKFPDGEHGRDLLAGLDLQEVYDVLPLCGAAGLGDLVSLELVDLAVVGEEQDIVMGGGREDIAHKVLLAGGHGVDAAAAAALGAVSRGGHALDIARVGEGIGRVLLLNEVLNVNLIGDSRDLGAALVGIGRADFAQLGLDDLEDIVVGGQDLVVRGDLALNLAVFLVELFLLQAGQAAKAHVDDGLGLGFIQVEFKVVGAVHDAEQGDLVDPERLAAQVLLGLGLRAGGADDGDDAVDVVLIGCDLEALQDVGAGGRAIQIEAGAAGDDVLLEGDVPVNDLAQGQHLGLDLVRAGVRDGHKGQVDHRAGVLQLGVVIELV